MVPFLPCVHNPVGNYMFKVDNRNTRTRCEICSKLTVIQTYFTPCSSVSIVNFEHVIADWEPQQTVVPFLMTQA